MINIDYYIEKTKEMPNISDGGSAAYSFGDVVLVKYSSPVQYREPRVDEENIAIAVNEKNAMGVRTPKHLAVKRTTDGKNNYCWVLQECAKGNNYTYYSYYSKDEETALERLKRILTAPSAHFEKFISDLGEIFNLGLELKPKNFFYDEDVLNGGFTIIDLLSSDKTPYDPKSIVDVYRLKQMIGCIYNSLGVFSDTATDKQKEISSLMKKKLKLRVFQAFEKVVPNFEQHRRWILRTYSVEDLSYFRDNGLEVGDLSLTDEEIVLFNKRVQDIIADCLRKVSTGENKYWQIGANKIRISLDEYTLNTAWKYHRDNQARLEDFEDSYEYDYQCNHELKRMVNDEFDRQLEAMSVDTENPYLLQAKEDLEKKKRKPRY